MYEHFKALGLVLLLDILKNSASHRFIGGHSHQKRSVFFWQLVVLQVQLLLDDALVVFNALSPGLALCLPAALFGSPVHLEEENEWLFEVQHEYRIRENPQLWWEKNE